VRERKKETGRKERANMEKERKGEREIAKERGKPVTNNLPLTHRGSVFPLHPRYCDLVPKNGCVPKN